VDICLKIQYLAVFKAICETVEKYESRT
jgi:hypothetical protein